MTLRGTGNLALHTAAGLATSYWALAVLHVPQSGEQTAVDLWRTAIPSLCLARGAAFWWADVSKTLWRYASIWDLRDLLMAIALGSALFAPATLLLESLHAYPVGAIALDAVFLAGALGGVRLIARLSGSERRASGTRRRVLIFGAGDAGELIVRDMKRDGRYEPVGFVDDDAGKAGRHIHGVPVLGSRHELPRILERSRPEEILVAIPSAGPAVLRGVARAFEPFTMPIRTLPSLRHLMSGTITVGHIHDLRIEDLLPRTQIGLDSRAVHALVAGRRVLVTGAGGSIGSELCRQIAALHPAELLMFDRYENGLHAVASGLAAHPFVTTVVGDVTDGTRIGGVFERLRPELVLHAAAHKHVPLMESNPCEAVKNNVIGTRMVAEAAVAHGVPRFVFISTDKAVHPSSVMGATKRIGELIVRRAGERATSNPFVVVRFGNVLGSNGSVLQTFVSQIRTGGPVTVTHADMRRYFMLPSEAVQLVLHAAAVDAQGCTCVLDLGEPLKVVDLARHLIRLSGFIPDEEIPIVFTGLRPGEKLSEQLVSDDEIARPSPVPEIRWVEEIAARGESGLDDELPALGDAALRGDESGTIASLWRIVNPAAPGAVPDAAIIPAMISSGVVSAAGGAPLDGPRASAPAQ